MHLRTALFAGAFALAPVFALAAPPAPSQPVAAQPLMVRFDGRLVPAQGSTHIVQTAAGPARVSTWHWQSPNGDASFVVQTSTGGAPPAWALQQMQAMQAQFGMMQAQMRQLEQAALIQPFTLPGPLSVVFAPGWVFNGMPDVVTVVAPSHGKSATPLPHAPTLKKV